MAQKQLTTDEDFKQYLEKINFSKRLKKLNKQLLGKRVVIYGAGAFFRTIKNNYDLSGLDVIAVSDKRFSDRKDGDEFMGYKVCAPDEIADINPDVVLVGTLNFINIIETLEGITLRATNIKIRPLIKKPFFEIIHEIWG